MPFCTNCGKEIAEDAAFCPHCGTPTKRAPGVLVPPMPAPPPTMELRYATISARFVAVLVDTILLAIVGFLIGIPFNIVAFFLAPPLENILVAWPLAVINALLWVGYFSYFEASSGQTFGKRMMGIKVVDVNGISGIDLGRSLVRNILRIIDFLPVFYIIGVLLIATNPRRQRLGDTVARTIVVRA